MNDEKRNWLAVTRAPGLGGCKLISALEASGGIEGLVSGSRSDLKSFGIKEEAYLAIRQPDQALMESDLGWLAEADHHLVTWDSDLYPPLLRRIPSPPAALFVEGNVHALWQPQLAIIGSRNPSGGGLEHAAEFSSEFCRRGMTITSGLASGIDSAAHRAALRSGGQTIAVTGTGLDRVYPASSRGLAVDIRGGGALVSEFPVGTPPKRSHFPSRNRIISGLSLGVLVIEAGLNSGTLITARKAAEQGRDVFALPGSLHNPMVKGCHRLIREGARLVETVDDVLSELAPLASELAKELASTIESAGQVETTPDAIQPDLLGDPDYQMLWDALGFDPRTMDGLVSASGLPVQSVSSMLLMLELKGLVTSHNSGRFSRSAGVTLD
jgi:DNA processing protein